MVNFYVFFTIIRKMITLDAVRITWLWRRKEGMARAKWKTTVKKQQCEMRVAWTVVDGEEGTDWESIELKEFNHQDWQIRWIWG